MAERDQKEDSLSGQAAVDKLRELLPSFRGCMYITADGSAMHARPMALQGDLSTFGGTLWFFADVTSRKVHESEGRQVTLTFQDDDKHAYVQLTGTAAVVRDMAKMRELYSPFVKTYFPDGLEDPNLVLLRFEATHGSFWDTPGGMVRMLGAFAKAAITGVPGKGGESGNLTLK